MIDRVYHNISNQDMVYSDHSPVSNRSLKHDLIITLARPVRTALQITGHVLFTYQPWLSIRPTKCTAKQNP